MTIGPRTRFAGAIATSLLLSTPPAVADGGRIVWAGTRGDVAAAIIVAPAAPRVGAIRIDWVGPADPQGVVHAMHENGLRERGLMVMRGDEHHVEFELLVPGLWELQVDPDGDGPMQGVEVSIELGPPLPAWRSQLVWLLAWIPMVAVGLYAGSRRR